MQLVAVLNPGVRCPGLRTARFTKQYRALFFRSGEPGGTVDFLAEGDGNHQFAEGCGGDYRFTYKPALGSTIFGQPINALANYERLSFDVGGLIGPTALTDGIAELTWRMLVNGEPVARGKERRPVRDLNGEHTEVTVEVLGLQEQLAEAIYTE
jgi:hypothetical protein